MKSFGAIAVAVAATAFLVGAASAEDNTVTVIGRAEAKQKPDVAYVTLYVKADGILMTDAAKKADQKVEEVRKALEEKSEVISSFDVTDVVAGERRRRNWALDREDETPRPEVTRRIRITAQPHPKEIYEIVDLAIRSGALMEIPTTIQYSSDVRTVVVYGLLESSELEAQAREAAMADAKEEARELAALGGKEIGAIVKVDSSHMYPWGFRCVSWVSWRTSRPNTSAQTLMRSGPSVRYPLHSNSNPSS